MSKASLDFFFYVSLFGTTPLGFLLLGLWIRRVYRPLVGHFRYGRPPQLPEIQRQTLVAMAPGLVLFAL